MIIIGAIFKGRMGFNPGIRKGENGPALRAPSLAAAFENTTIKEKTNRNIASPVIRGIR
jgi:hypothetical protein